MLLFYPCAKTKALTVLKRLFVFVALLFTNQVFSQPSITSFTPVSGPVGTTVTITGDGFSAVETNNIVFFGAVRAEVTYANATTLRVKVPTGTTYEPITVTRSGRTGYAAKPFTVTFNLNNDLNPASFATADIAAATVPTDVCMSDLDADGKPDLIVLNNGSSSFSVFKNNSTPQNVSFLPKTDHTTEATPLALITGDINGDGKPDVVITNKNSHTISVFINNSTTSGISFEAKENFPSGPAYSTFISDIDGDGKRDLIVTNGINTVSVLRNNGTQQNISFANKVDFTSGISTLRPFVSDINGDTKPDILVANLIDNSFSVLINTSLPGDISFANKVDYATPALPQDIAAGDFDNDGKNDVVITATGQSGFSNMVSVFRNTSANETVSFAPRVNYSTDENPKRISINDIDGDAKPDLVVTNYNTHNVSILKNNSIQGVIFFASKKDFLAGNSPLGVQTGDVDGDKKPDIAVANTASNTISILSSQPEPTINSFSPTSGAGGTQITISGTHLDGATDVRIGQTPVTSFTQVSPTTITAIIAAGSRGRVSVTTPLGVASLDGFGLTPTITAFAPASGPIETIVNITGSNFSATANRNTVYFGSAKADVISATPTTLVVRVPAGTTYSPITVTTNNLTAYSAQPFNVTFPRIGAAFAPNSFGGYKNYQSGLKVNDLHVGDIDGDGKNDVVVANTGSDSISVFRNTSIFGTISFARKVPGFFDAPKSVNLADIDGDGKPDLITGNATTIFVNKNLSIIGNVLFAPTVEFPISDGLAYIAVNDLDGDGKPDIAIAGNTGVLILKNTTNAGIISFDPPVLFIAGYLPQSLAISDLDDDGKPDIVIASEQSSTDDQGKISIFKNTTVAGAPFSAQSFAAKTDHLTEDAPTGVKIADLNADGKPDIIVTNEGSTKISIFPNTSVAGAISLATKLDYFVGRSAQKPSIADLDGDGKPDILIPQLRTQSISLLKNESIAGPIAFALKEEYNMSGEPITSSIADLDIDGKPDLLLANFSEDGFSVFRNQVAEPTTEPSGSRPVRGDIVNRTFVDAAVKTFNGTPYVQRHYDIIPANDRATATGTVTLYFTQQEFNNFNATANHGPDLPTSATDMAGKASLRVFQFNSLSVTGDPESYTGIGVEINPDDNNIVWNPTAQWWAVTFNTNGFGGFFLSNEEFKFHVPSAPTITANGATSFCEGGHVTLTSSATANNQWYKDGVVIAGATATTYQANTSGTYTVITTINGTSSPVSAGIVVTVNALPAKPTITRNGTVLQSSAASGNQWYKDRQAITGATGVSLTLTGAGNYSVQVSINGCASPESDPYNYQPPASPSAPTITVNGATDFCEGEQVTLRSSAAANNQWYKNGGIITGANSATYQANTSGTYTVITTVNGVTSPSSTGVTVRVTSLPAKPTITRNGLFLESSSLSGNQWYKNGIAITAAIHSTFKPVQPGNYTVKVTTQGCTGPESDAYDYVVTGVIDIDNSQYIKLNPNPVKDHVLLEFNVTGSPALTLQIIDMQGRICKTFVNQINGSYLSFAGLSNGAYIVNIFTRNLKQRYTMQMVKQ